MDKNVVDRLKNFIEENKDMVKENKWADLFSRWRYDIRGSIDGSALSELLDHAGVDYISHCSRIEDFTYYGRDDLTKVEIPSNIEKIGYSSFCRCHNLKEVIINEGAAAIDSWAFSYCENLKRVTLPDSVTSIEPETFLESAKVVIKGHAGTYAEDYCKKNGIKYEII